VGKFFGKKNTTPGTPAGNAGATPGTQPKGIMAKMKGWMTKLNGGKGGKKWAIYLAIALGLGVGAMGKLERSAVDTLYMHIRIVEF